MVNKLSSRLETKKKEIIHTIIHSLYIWCNVCVFVIQLFNTSIFRGINFNNSLFRDFIALESYVLFLLAFNSSIRIFSVYQTENFVFVTSWRNIQYSLTYIYLNVLKYKLFIQYIAKHTILLCMMISFWVFWTRLFLYFFFFCYFILFLYSAFAAHCGSLWCLLFHFPFI